MNRLWLLVGFALAGAGCSSDNTASPAPASAGGTSGSATSGTSAAVSGTGGAVASVVAGRGPGPAGTGAISAPAGSGGMAAVQAGAAASQAGTGSGRAGGGAPQAGQTGGVSGAPAAGSGGSGPSGDLEHFSFFITSHAGLQKLSKKQEGFGGDLRYGQADGLAGADKICTELAESSMPGSGAKGWRAFLSATKGPDGMPVNAIDRVGSGPWYDRIGRVVAMTKTALANTRPQGADPMIANDLPNEEGVPNQRPDPAMPAVNNHHILTGSDAMGKLYGSTATCSDWTTTAKNAGRPRIGFSYPAGNRQHWISGQDEGGCGAGAVLVDMGGSDPNNPIVGSGGGYGGFYCFALKP